MRKPWTESELRTCVVFYGTMLYSELTGAKYTKSFYNKMAANITGKSRGSIEFMMCNISAACEKAGLPTIKGYKPRDNYNKMLDTLIQQDFLNNEQLGPLLKK